MYIYITGVPGKVPMITITNSTNGNIINFTLRWGEPFNNYDPIIMYHVSCSGDAPCPQSYNTTINHTTFTGFTPNSYYTFSVVAINSIGSGEAGVVMVGEIINTTIAPSVVSMSTTTTTTAEVLTITLTMDTMLTNTASSMITINNNPSTMINILTMTTAIMPTSMVEVVTTFASSEIVTSTTTTITTTITSSSKCIMHA